MFIYTEFFLTIKDQPKVGKQTFGGEAMRLPIKTLNKISEIRETNSPV